MTLEDALTQLDALRDPKAGTQNPQPGVSDTLNNVRMGDVRKLAKQIRTDHALALSLWETGDPDARLLSILLLKPKQLPADALDRMVRSVSALKVADWLGAYVIKKHPAREALRQGWVADDEPMAARAGWALTAAQLAKQPDGLDLDALLDRIESELAAAAPVVQWTMNMTLAEIGIRSPAHRARAVAIGESLGVYRDYPTSRGCTSPFAPAWISAVAAPQG